MSKTVNPQTENGFTKIADEILDALIRHRIPGEQRQCLDFIIRKTYGYGKKEDRISNSQFVEATGMNKANICRSLRELSKKQLIVKNDNTNPTTYRFNKHYNDWIRLSKKTTVVKDATDVVKKDNKSLSKVTDTIDSIDTLQKTDSLISGFDFSGWPTLPGKQTVADWIKIRNGKKLKLTQTGVSRMAKQIEMAAELGWTADDVLGECVERAWAGFKCEWIKDKPKKQAQPPAPQARLCADCLLADNCKEETKKQWGYKECNAWRDE